MEAALEAKSAFSTLLLEWFEKRRRSFPWREIKDPYKILMAEIMLQRTRADQVVPAYRDFIREFPTINDLKSASLKHVGKYFRQLGLFWRAELVKKMADDVIVKFNGKIPSERNKLLSICSIGDYIADAVLAFAFGKNVAVVDSNVCRVIGRVFALGLKKEARRDPTFKNIPQQLLKRGKAREFNWAMIDLASLICLPKNPKCSECPLCILCRFASRSHVICSKRTSL